MRPPLNTIMMLPIQGVEQGDFDNITDALNVAEFKWVCRVGTLIPGGNNLVMPSYRASQDQEFTDAVSPAYTT